MLRFLRSMLMIHSRDRIAFLQMRPDVLDTSGARPPKHEVAFDPAVEARSLRTCRPGDFTVPFTRCPSRRDVG